MANAARQEVSITFDGKDYDVRPTFEVISNIEAVTGASCYALAEKCYAVDATGLPSLTTTAQIIFNLLKPFKGPSAERVAEVLLEDGAVGLYVPLGDVLSRALRGNKDHMKRAEEAAAKAKGAVKDENRPDPPEGGSTSSDG